MKYSIKGVSSNGLGRGGYSIKSLDPYLVLISLSVRQSIDHGQRQLQNYKQLVVVVQVELGL